MSNPSRRRRLGCSLYWQVDDEDKHSLRGAQLLLAGAILQQYCTVGEEEDEGEDELDVIDVRHLTAVAFVFLIIFLGYRRL